MLLLLSLDHLLLAITFSMYLMAYMKKCNTKYFIIVKSRYTFCFYTQSLTINRSAYEKQEI